MEKKNKDIWNWEAHGPSRASVIISDTIRTSPMYVGDADTIVVCHDQIVERLLTEIKRLEGLQKENIEIKKMFARDREALQKENTELRRALEIWKMKCPSYDTLQGKTWSQAYCLFYFLLSLKGE